ncbi:unnamed protein product [Aspergillus oryzae var. brunneus]|uniref:Unnamed protein product n=1 Tax=Aspergillus oryzae var. brunneus TaxID=332754 RepID=A0ABQ6L1E2_ASPOZ|nr:unnamed protein product [Aspergillus oryzae]GMG08399.1 unnamed protein product [Aspergillus oryzae]GMG49743.1 unnamed protein product [Aspergillus oryzae var. brunneus]
MLEQDATADEIAAYSVTVQVVPPLPVKDELAVGTETGVVTTAVEDVAAFATLTIWAVLVLKVKDVGVAVAEVI